MSGHTPGPWVAGWGDGLSGPTTPSLDGATCGGREWKIFPVSKGMETIAICPNQIERGKSLFMQADGSALANARLIAAAPDMLEALKAAYDFIATEYASAKAQALDGELVDAVARPVFSMVCAAIAKAEGRS